MTKLILSDEQVKAVRTSADAVEVRDPEGNLLGDLTPPFRDSERAEALRRLRSDGPWYSTQQVHDRLDSPGRS